MQLAHVDGPGGHRQRVGDEEVAEVATHHRLVQGDLPRAPAAEGEPEHGDPRDEHREAGEHERRPQDRPDAHVVGGRSASEDDGDDRHQRLRQGGPDRGEHAAHGPFAELVATAEPLDAVGEELGRDQDDGEGDDEQQVGHTGGKDTRRERAGRGDPAGPFASRDAVLRQAQTQPLLEKYGQTK